MPTEVVPVVGTLCKTLLALGQLVETAQGHKEDLEVLLELCDVGLAFTSEPPGFAEGRFREAEGVRGQSREGR